MKKCKSTQGILMHSYKRVLLYVQKFMQKLLLVFVDYWCTFYAILLPSKCCINNSSFNFRLGEVCSHVAAILFKIEASVRLGYNKVACTSMPCLWNQNFTKKVNLNWNSFIFVLNFCRIMIILLIYISFSKILIVKFFKCVYMHMLK